MDSSTPTFDNAACSFGGRLPGPARQRTGGGLFISLEGPEGVGKSTQAVLLTEALRRQGQVVCQTREPGGTPLGERIRRMVKHLHGGEAPCPEAELLLMGAGRVQHVRDVIAPALLRGETVVCDRFADSTTVYQGCVRGLDSEFIRAMHDLTVGECWPDMTLILDMDVQRALNRGRQRNARRKQAERDRFDDEDVSFHKRVRSGFLRLAADDPDRVAIVDADADEATVHQRIMKVLKGVLDSVS